MKHILPALILLLFSFIFALLGMQLFGYQLEFCESNEDAAPLCPPGAQAAAHPRSLAPPRTPPPTSLGGASSQAHTSQAHTSRNSEVCRSQAHTSRNGGGAVRTPCVRPPGTG